MCAPTTNMATEGAGAAARAQTHSRQSQAIPRGTPQRFQSQTEAALAIVHAKLREDNAKQRKIVAEYEHYCILLEQTLSQITQAPVELLRENYRQGKPLLYTRTTP